MIGDADDIKRALRRYLQGPEFQTVLARIAAEKGDGFYPPLPVYIYQEERLSHLTFPMAELVVYRSVFNDDDVVKRTVHEIGIRWTAVAKDEATVTKYVERLVRATTDLLWLSTLDTQVQSGPIVVTEEDYSPLVPSVDHPYVKSGIVMLQVPVWRS